MDSMDVNEITKVIDGVYKNISENFNPASKQMIATGKAYLKSLHGASAACSMYLDALVKLSKQAQQSSVGTSLDIGSSMMQIADVFKEIHTQQLTTLKAFYVDFLVPLETNLEKDVKVVQNEQKKFLVSHKHRVESYNKAVSSAKKVRKKSKKSSTPSSSTLDKEIRIMQTMEEERSKLEGFCEEALREALTQERRRYGFILERQASLAKHYLAFYSKGSSSLNQKLDGWMKVAKSREALPESMQANLVKKIQQGEEECIYCSPRRPADDTASISSQLRKTKSMEAGEILNIQNSSTGSRHVLTNNQGGGHHNHNVHHHLHPDLPLTSAGSLSRAKSDTSLGMSNNTTCNGGGGGVYGTSSMALMTTPTNEHGPPIPPENFRSASNKAMTPQLSSPASNEPAHVGYAKALYAYLSNGDNQLSFLEGDIIALFGDRNRGWQFGENMRTQKMGWFPVAYTEVEQQKPSMLIASESMKATPSPVPPPMPPPIPAQQRSQPDGNNGAKGKTGGGGAKSNLMIPSSGRTSDSLHSSNDSGFSTDIHHHHGTHPVPPPPQPEVDYSDEEPQISNRSEDSSGNKWLMDRYHMSESARMNSSTRRRSLSSGNLSTGEQDLLRNSNIRNASLHNGAGSSPRGPHHQLATAYYDEKDAKNGGDGGPLKKFLNRTKSLIWRRPSNAGDQYQNGNGMSNQPQQALESISIADTASELWGSHSSIVEMTEFEIKELNSSNGIIDKHHHHHRTQGAEDVQDVLDNDYFPNENKRRSGKNSRGLLKETSTTGPSLPPRNNADQYVQRGGASNKMQMSPGSSSVNTNVSSSATSNMSIQMKETDSCLVVSDHTRPKKSPSGGVAHDMYEPSFRSVVYRGGKNKENDIDMIQKQRKKQASALEQKVSSRNGKSSSKMGVSRVESFAVSEAPIVPENSAKFSRRSIASGSVALSTRTSHSRMVNGKSNGDHSSTLNSAKQSKPEEMRGRRRLWDNHANDDSNNSDNDNEHGVEEEEDEGTIDFNDNDDYDDEASSSVFIEAENEDGVSGSKSMSVLMTHGKMLPQKLVSNEQPKSILLPASSMRSKSSDVKHHPHDTRRSRSTSVKSGVDNGTVEMPKRHGGFKIQGRNPINAAQTEGVERAKERAHSSVRSIPSSRNIPEEEMKRSNNESSRNLSAQQGPSKGLTYKGRPIGSPPPIPAPLPQHKQMQPQQHPPAQSPPPPPSGPMNGQTVVEGECEASGDVTEAEPDYGTIKGSPTPPRKEQVMKIVPHQQGKHRSLIIRDEGKNKHPRGPWKGSIRSEIHTVELITTDVRGDKPVLDYGSYIHRRLYYPERGSRIDQKSERSGNYCGPWYDLWGEDPSVPVYERHFMENQYPTLKFRRARGHPDDSN